MVYAGILAHIEHRYQLYGNWSNASTGYFAPTNTIYNKLKVYGVLIAAAGVFEAAWWYYTPQPAVTFHDSIDMIAHSCGMLTKYIAYFILYSGLMLQIAATIYISIREKWDSSCEWIVIPSALGALASLLTLQWLTIPAVVAGGSVVLIIYIIATVNKAQIIQEQATRAQAARDAERDRIIRERNARQLEEWRAKQPVHGLGRFQREQMARNRNTSLADTMERERRNRYGLDKSSGHKHPDYVHDDGYGNKFNNRYKSLHWTLKASYDDCLHWTPNYCNRGDRKPCGFTNDQHSCPYFKESANYKRKVDQHLKNGTL